MNAKEFKKRVEALQLTSIAIPAARAILVDGGTYRQVAKKFEVDMALLFRLCQRIKTATFCETCGRPFGPKKKGASMSLTRHLFDTPEGKRAMEHLRGARS